MAKKPVAYHYDDKGYYIGEMERQIDPLESKLAGKDIYLIPGDSTLTKPLKEKEGFKIKWNKETSEWEYEEVEKEKEIEEYVPTEAEKIQSEIAEKKCLLSQSDYKAIKFAEGWISEEEYAPIKAERQAIRDEINALEAQLAEIKATTTES